jgi:hypothetical protein
VHGVGALLPGRHVPLLDVQLCPAHPLVPIPIPLIVRMHVRVSDQRGRVRLIKQQRQHMVSSTSNVLPQRLGAKRSVRSNGSRTRRGSVCVLHIVAITVAFRVAAASTVFKVCGHHHGVAVERGVRGPNSPLRWWGVPMVTDTAFDANAGAGCCIRRAGMRLHHTIRCVWVT